MEEENQLSDATFNYASAGTGWSLARVVDQKEGCAKIDQIIADAQKTDGLAEIQVSFRLEIATHDKCRRTLDETLQLRLPKSILLKTGMGKELDPVSNCRES